MSISTFFRKDEDLCRCLICPHYCSLKTDEKGICDVRQNVAGSIVALNYGQVSAIALDPIEKKPLYHYYPGENILSLGSLGCNLACEFCQNWPLVSYGQKTSMIGPGKIIERAQQKRSFGLAYTYSEPLMWFEYLLEIMPLAKSKGLKNVLVTNGFINKGPLLQLLAHLDAVNLDIKSFNHDTYEERFGGKLAPILDNALLFNESCHLEITTLIVPGINDDLDEIVALAKWIAKNLGEETPLHLSRYFPAYRYLAEPTSLELLITLFNEIKKILPFVYLGNIQEDAYRKTRCPSCNKVVVERHGVVRVFLNEKDECPFCGQYINIII